jgi:hypothetical protein
VNASEASRRSPRQDRLLSAVRPMPRYLLA